MENMNGGTSLVEIVGGLRRTFRTNKTLPLEFRLKQLKRLWRMLDEHSDEICEALYKDLRKPKAEAYCYEIQVAYNDLDLAIKNLRSWMACKQVNRNIMQILDSACTVKQPVGVVLIISAWNYPVNLLLIPLIGALAAGNCAVLKPSELAVHTGQLFRRIINDYLSKDIVRVVLGGPDETSRLLELRFDYIFFTGSSKVGRIVMESASRYLTPVTLELGGKCPAVVDRNVKLDVVAKRIAWGKYMACGQTCVAPDYVLCHSDVKEKFVRMIAESINEFYGTDPQRSSDYGRILNRQNMERLSTLLNDCTVLVGGRTDLQDLYMEPTVVQATLDDEIMQQEIFGPILPVITVDSMEAAILIINDREKPLSVYLFSPDKTVQQKFIEQTYSGAMVINDVVVHLALESLPFGGIGASGMGRYHGKYTFDTFSHEKAILKRPEYGESVLWMRYPPITDSKFFWAKTIIKRRPLAKLCMFLMCISSCFLLLLIPVFKLVRHLMEF